MKRKILVSTLSIAFLCGALALSFTNKQQPVVEADAAQHAANFDAYTYSGNYYNGISGTGDTLRSQLTTLIHPAGWYTYSGSSGAEKLATVLQSADEDPTNSSNMVYFYTRDSVTKNAASTWNREHVWPQNLSNGCWGTSNAGTDILHIRPTYNKTNGERDNDKYGNATNGTSLTYQGMPYGKESGKTFEPLDSVKGDAARIIMYVWVAYKNHYNNLPAITNVFTSYDTMMEWHIADKPDVLEGHRNDFSETSKQKNRNPFVDHPEYAWKIFGDKCSASVLAAAKAAYPDGGGSGGDTPVTQYTVTFNSNGGSSVASQTVNSGATATKPADPTRTGYTFGGWYTDAACTQSFSFSTAITGNITLYAKWTIKTYTVSFNSNGGSSVSSVTVNHGSKATKPEDPTKDGYAFGGWYSDSALTAAFDFNTTITSNTILYAKWNVNAYTVTFETNGGSTITPVSVNHGEKVAEPNAPTKDNYVFVGWYKESTFKTAYDFDTAVTGNLTIYAKWIEQGSTIQQFTVTFNTNGGSSISSKAVNEGDKITKPADPTKEGYTFSGWFKDEGLTQAFNFESDTITANTTLYAKWVVATYTVSFETDGGSVVTSAIVNHGEKVTKPADPTKEGYTFDGWYVDSNFALSFDFNTAITADITLYAKWVEIPAEVTYTISFYANGGKGTMNPIAVIEGYKYTVPVCDFEAPEGKIFDYWRNGEDKYNAGAEITINDNLLLIAVWKAKPTDPDDQPSGGDSTHAGGCHGSIIASSAIISITSLLGFGLLMLKKRK